MNGLKNIFIVITLGLPAPETMAQLNRMFIHWTRISGSVTVKKTEYYAEAENSYRINAAHQDYFTVLANARYRFKHISPGLGFSYWLLYDSEEEIVPEWRPHLQLQWEKEKNRWVFAHRTRLENRFIRDTSGERISSAYNYTFRPRMLFQAGYCLAKERNKRGNLQLVLSSEVLLVYNRVTKDFSENRLYAGLWYELARQTSLQLGYMWIFSKKDEPRNTDIIYLTLRKDITVKRKGPNP